jgi:hypothetical protein
MPLDHEDQGLRLKSKQPVMYDNLLAASAARRLSNTCGSILFKLQQLLGFHEWALG